MGSCAAVRRHHLSGDAVNLAALPRLDGNFVAVIRQLHCGYTATLLRLLAAFPVVLTRIFTELGTDLHL